LTEKSFWLIIMSGFTKNILPRTSYLALRLETLRFSVRSNRYSSSITISIIIVLASILSACNSNRIAVIPQPTQPSTQQNSVDAAIQASPVPTASASNSDSPPATRTSSAADEQTTATGDAINGEAIFNGTLLVSGAAPCVACHQVSGTVAVVGPNLANIANEADNRVTGMSASDYLHESIVAPNSYLVEGFSASIMPLNYADTLSEEQVDDLVAYLLTLD
jgi:cytochrome c